MGGGNGQGWRIEAGQRKTRAGWPICIWWEATECKERMPEDTLHRGIERNSMGIAVRPCRSQEVGPGSLHQLPPSRPPTPFLPFHPFCPPLPGCVGEACGPAHVSHPSSPLGPALPHAPAPSRTPRPPPPLQVVRVKPADLLTAPIHAPPSPPPPPLAQGVWSKPTAYLASTPCMHAPPLPPRLCW